MHSQSPQFTISVAGSYHSTTVMSPAALRHSLASTPYPSLAILRSIADFLSSCESQPNWFESFARRSASVNETEVPVDLFR
jgi:hypothetical protein